jgi:nucleotide-binding universal stress UspA family protein
MYKRALVPLDGSAESEAIIPFICEIAGPLDIEVVLLRVLTLVPPAVLDAARPIVLDDVEARHKDAEEYMAPLAAELRSRGIRVATEVRRGQPPAEIIAAGRETGADMIAMTTHGRSGFGRLLFGSVAEAVLRQAEVPVFLMRQTEAQVAERARKTARP